MTHLIRTYTICTGYLVWSEGLKGLIIYDDIKKLLQSRDPLDTASERNEI